MSSQELEAVSQNSASPKDQKLVHQFAYMLRHRAAALYAEASVGGAWNRNVPIQAYDLYMQQLLKDAGSPGDPVEQMLVEQLAMAHHNIGRLYGSAAKATDTQQIKAYNGAAVRFLAEFRRMAETLRTYRTPVPSKQFTVVKQQNLAAGDQQVAYVDSDSTQPPQKKDMLNTQVGNKEAISYEPQTQFIPEPQSSRSRETEPAEAWAADPGGPREASASCLEEPALEVFNGPENTGGEGGGGPKRQTSEEGGDVDPGIEGPCG